MTTDGGRIDGLASWHAGLRAAVQRATAHPVRIMWWIDRDFRGWPLDDAEVLQALNAWVRLPGRELLLLAADFTELPRRHARFVAWRTPWSHVVRGRTWDAALKPPPGAALWADDGTWLRLHDDDPPRGAWGVGGPEAVHVHHSGDAIAQQSIASFSVSVTGL